MSDQNHHQSKAESADDGLRVKALNDRIELLCGDLAIEARGDSWRLLRERLGDDEEAQTALTWLLADLGEALAFVSIEGSRYASTLSHGVSLSERPPVKREIAVYEGVEEGELPFPDELKACQDALADIEIHIYEAWTFGTITKDAARHFLAIAAICDWTMPWVEDMREWAS